MRSLPFFSHQLQQGQEKVDHSYEDAMAVISSGKCNSPDHT